MSPSETKFAQYPAIRTVMLSAIHLARRTLLGLVGPIIVIFLFWLHGHLYYEVPQMRETVRTLTLLRVATCKTEGKTMNEKTFQCEAAR